MSPMSDLSEKERQIAAAALRVFSRYGLKRATMNDVAEEAGVVRQTLYNVFANKDEVIHGTLLYYCELLRTNVRAAWDGVDDLPTKLDHVWEHYVVASWDAVRAAPDAGDLESGSTAAAKSAMLIAESKLQAMLAEALAPHNDALHRNGLDPAQFAAFVVATAMGLKHGADDRGALLRHLEALKTSVVLSTR